MTAPRMMTIAPMNMARRRPSLSERIAANGAATMEPLMMSDLSTCALICHLHRIERVHDGNLGSNRFSVERVFEVVHGYDSRHEGSYNVRSSYACRSNWRLTVIPIGARAAKCNEDGDLSESASNLPRVG